MITFLYFIRFYSSNIFSKHIVFAIVFYASISCQAPAVQKIELLDLDYYFGESWLQIQGIAKLPQIKQKLRGSQSQLAKGMQYNFLTLTQRRKQCHKSALLNAHTKFLSISQKQWLSQSEWRLRLKLGAKGDWHKCLMNAQVVDTFYDIPGSCRLVILYTCDPRNY